MDMWTQSEAIELARLIEAVAPAHGAHVALTGGLLYKDGPRKDADFLFYCIRQRDRIDENALLAALADIGLLIGVRKGWVRKAVWMGKSVDLFFPEAYPASAGPTGDGQYGRFDEPGDIPFP